MSTTIECKCGFCTDVEETSETNPSHCPKCGGDLFYAGTDLEFPEPKFDLDDCTSLSDLHETLMEMKKTYEERENLGQGYDGKCEDYYGVDFSSLPTFGGDELDDTTGIWSWDDKNVLIGDGSVFEWKIEARQ